MGKQQLTLLCIHRFFLSVFYLDGHISQAEALHLGTEGLLRYQRNQGGTGFQNRMSQLPCQVISISGGAGKRIGYTAGGDNYRPTGIKPVLSLYTVTVEEVFT